jgi:phage head maturation protease
MSEQEAIKILNETDDSFTVGGYGIVFGGVDIEGETFTKDTDFWLPSVPTKAVFYDHSAGQKMPVVVGETVKEVPDDVGVWVELQIERATAYAEVVKELINKGVPLGLSSGAVGHLARRENGRIKSWPIFEYSITPTPAEPRTVGLERVKQLAETYKS